MPTAPDAGTKQTSPVTLIVIGLAIAFAIGLRIKQAIDLRTPVMAEATLRGKTFQVEVADTAAKREKGLGERDSLAADAGMYFPFPNAQRWSFWMKGMRFPIDIIWIREGKVVDIHHRVPVEPTPALPTYSPVLPADAVLELNAGVAEEIGLKPGDFICFGTCPSEPPPAVILEPVPAATGTPAIAPAATGTPAVAPAATGTSGISTP